MSGQVTMTATTKATVIRREAAVVKHVLLCDIIHIHLRDKMSDRDKMRVGMIGAFPRFHTQGIV
jgi:hypothetical protein